MVFKKIKDKIDVVLHKKPLWPKELTEQEYNELVRTTEQATEAKIYQNLNLLELFQDETESGVLAKFMPYIGAIISVITLIVLIAKK